MCGILGILSPAGRSVGLDDAVLAGMRDCLSHRGPDGAGLLVRDNIALAHRRLAILDPGPAGAQPFRDSEGRFALVYNGELYNDRELRAALTREGVTFHTRCDTETVLHALRLWGTGALQRFRGMYALAFADFQRQQVMLARDPLGIKPLYVAQTPMVRGCSGLVFSSEIRGVLAHPELSAQPDLFSLCGYMTTIRVTQPATGAPAGARESDWISSLVGRTMYRGIGLLEPGQALSFDLHAREDRIAAPEVHDWWTTPAARVVSRRAEDVRAQVEESIVAHLRSEVPLCCLLSGGLDSAITATVTNRALRAGGSAHTLRTYCAGHKPAAGEKSAVPGVGDDFLYARLVAGTLGTDHAEAEITGELFAQRWPAMIEAMGVPLSTPNEVAIHEVASRLRADGHLVTISGEGADELFAGYELPMQQAAEFESGRGAYATQAASGGEFQFLANAWLPPAQFDAVLQPETMGQGEHARQLAALYRVTFERVSERCEPADVSPASSSRLAAHLAFHRRVNLHGLLLRLDTATMLAGVEGRTPLADASLAVLAAGLPMRDRYDESAATRDPSAPWTTKRVLRAAFRDSLPAEVVERPKASFPLPFVEWCGRHAGVLKTSALAREWFTAPAIELVASRPTELWRLAWPMINLALWARRFE